MAEEFDFRRREEESSTTSISTSSDLEPHISIKLYPRLVADSELIYQKLREVGATKVIDIETLVCLDESACIAVMEQLIKSSRAMRVTVSQLTWFRSIILFDVLLASNSHMLTSFEKNQIARRLCLSSFMLFMIAKDNVEFIEKLKSLAVLVYTTEESPDRALARMMCDLFQKYYDTPDEWLNRVVTYALAILNALAAAAVVRPRPEGEE